MAKKEIEKVEKIKSELFRRKDVNALIKMQNVLSLKRINYPDHGKNHLKIVIHNSLKIYNLLKKKKIKTTTEKQHNFGEEEVKVILLMASALHDIGMSVDREFHEVFSVVIAKDIINDILKKYYDTQKAVIIQSEILHCIFSHRRKGNPKTLEAQIVRLADGLDIAKGRTKMILDRETTNMHLISSFSIKSVDIKKGNKKPILIDIKMSNPAGLFLVGEFLKEKIRGTELEKYVEIKAKIIGEKGGKII